MRTKKILGAVALLAFVALYTFFAAAIGDVAFVDAPWPAQTAYFLIAGLLWILPAGLIIWWMQRPARSGAH